MNEITINEDQLITLTAIIEVSRKMFHAYLEHEQTEETVANQIIFHQLVREEDYRLRMAYDILAAIGLDYDPDAGKIIRRREV